MGRISKNLRLYIIDKPSFMSAGKTYITNDRNEIVIEDSGTDNSLHLEFIEQHSVSHHKLAPDPIPRNYSWIAPIKKGTRVFPVDVVDMCNELYNNDREYRPVILSRIDLSREELDRIIKLYNHRLKSYLAQVRERMKEIDTLYQPKLKKLKQQIKSEKREVLRRKPAGLDLGKIVLSNIGNFPNF